MAGKLRHKRSQIAKVHLLKLKDIKILSLGVKGFVFKKVLRKIFGSARDNCLGNLRCDTTRNLALKNEIWEATLGWACGQTGGGGKQCMLTSGRKDLLDACNLEGPVGSARIILRL